MVLGEGCDNGVFGMGLFGGNNRESFGVKSTFDGGSLDNLAFPVQT